MKKIILFIFLFSIVLILPSCKKTEFQEGLKYEEEIEGLEKEVILSKVKEEFKNVNSIKLTTENYSYSNLETTKNTVTLDGTLYQNSRSKIVTTSKEYSKKAGVELTEEEKSTSYVFFDNDKKLKVEYVVNDEDSDISKTSYLTDELYQKARNDYYTDTLSTMSYLFNSLKCYKKSKGYSFINSSEERNVQAVQWGSETKEYRESNYQQAILEIDSDYHITKYTNLNEEKANRDEDTNEWYKDEKTISSVTTSIEFKYGSKGSLSNDEISHAYSKYFVNAEIVLENGSERIYPASTEVKSSDINKKHIISKYNINGYPFSSSEYYELSTAIDYETATISDTDSETRHWYIDFTVPTNSIVSHKDKAISFTYNSNFTLIFEVDLEISNGNVKANNARVYIS